jgi:hypothetical protein
LVVVVVLHFKESEHRLLKMFSVDKVRESILILPRSKVFREWVHLRKEDDLAHNKKEKTIVATYVVRQVQQQQQQQQNGRFLIKDTSVVGGSGGHW